MHTIAICCIGSVEAGYRDDVGYIGGWDVVCQA
jgi:hypothetical protein